MSPPCHRRTGQPEPPAAPAGHLLPGGPPPRHYLPPTLPPPLLPQLPHSGQDQQSPPHCPVKPGDGRTNRVLHRLNTELDLQSLFGLLCTAVLIGWDSATVPLPPGIWAHIRGRYGSAKKEDIWPWGTCLPIEKQVDCNMWIFICTIWTYLLPNSDNVSWNTPRDSLLRHCLIFSCVMKHNLESSQTCVSIYNVNITNKFQTNFDPIVEVEVEVTLNSKEENS